jgi:hypothetical protein
MYALMQKYSSRLDGFMSRWRTRSVPGWQPGWEADDAVRCVQCHQTTWYDGDHYTPRFQPSGRYICHHCRPQSREMVALCQSLPYEVLHVFLNHHPPRRVTEVTWAN